jgi:putative transposase
MGPLRGWGPRGRRLVARVPHGHWRTLTFLAALRADAITAPCLFDGPINGESFLRYVEQFLVPTLKPGDVVVMDNLGSHKAAAIRQALRAAGARLIYLAPYSPDLNPIEQAFSKLKHWLRTAGSAPSTTLASASHRSSRPSPRQNAGTTSSTQDTVPSRVIPL